jgi:hypothetical protein
MPTVSGAGSPGVSGLAAERLQRIAFSSHIARTLHGAISVTIAHAGNPAHVH